MGRSRVKTASRAVLRSEGGRRSLRGRLAQARAREAELEALLRESEQRRLLAEDRAEKVRRMAGAVAHDVNNLLGVVALVASSLREKLAPRIREQADELCDSAIRAAQLNRQLLALGQRDLGAGDETVDVNVVIDGMRRLLERLAGASLDLVVDLDAEPCVVRADPAQLERVIINLVTNARDAMPDRGTLRIETAHTARCDGPRGEAVVVRVSDTGAGIDPATQGRIFEPFFTTKGSAGTGLGLAAVREIVAACGGSVQVESRPGGGTRFEVLLPVSSACETLPASAPSNA